MKTLKRLSIVIAISIAALLGGGWLLAERSGELGDTLELAESDKQSLGLMTSLPIYWGEGDAFASLGDEASELPWVRSAMERRYSITPLDVLSASEGQASPIETLDRLAIIQPRGLSPADNVALDEWVKGGGKLLYVIDPMLTGEYDVAIGDPRHPIVSALVPPLFERWGYRLTFNEDQGEEPRLIEWDGLQLPVLMAGQLAPLTKAAPEDESEAQTLSADATIAHFPWGKGQVTIFSDAALFEPEEGNDEARAALLTLLQKSFNQ